MLLQDVGRAKRPNVLLDFPPHWARTTGGGNKSPNKTIEKVWKAQRFLTHARSVAHRGCRNLSSSRRRKEKNLVWSFHWIISASSVGAEQSRDLIQTTSLLLRKKRKKKKDVKTAIKFHRGSKLSWGERSVRSWRWTTPILALTLFQPGSGGCQLRLETEVFLSGSSPTRDHRCNFSITFFPPPLSLPLSLSSVLLALQLAQRLWLHVADVRRARGAEARIRTRSFMEKKKKVRKKRSRDSSVGVRLHCPPFLPIEETVFPSQRGNLTSSLPGTHRAPLRKRKKSTYRSGRKSVFSLKCSNNKRNRIPWSHSW